MHETFLDLVTAVRAGAALLDGIQPEWRKKVNPATINIASSYHCILGQSYRGCFVEGYSALSRLANPIHPRWGVNRDAGRALGWSHEFGFSARHLNDVPRLNGIWQKILARPPARPS